MTTLWFYIQSGSYWDMKGKQFKKDKSTINLYPVQLKTSLPSYTSRGLFQCENKSYVIRIKVWTFCGFYLPWSTCPYIIEIHWTSIKITAYRDIISRKHVHWLVLSRVKSKSTRSSAIVQSTQSHRHVL